MKSLRLITLAFCVWLAPMVMAQTPPTAAQRTEQEEARKELEQKALASLEQLLKEAQELRLPENRLYALAVSANLLWGHDEKRARALLAEALPLFTQAVAEWEEENDARGGSFAWMAAEFRREVASVLSERDPQMALDFVAGTRSAMEKLGQGNAENEAQIEAALAQKIAASDPQRALRIAEQLLQSDKSLHATFGLLHSLRDKQPDTARKLMEMIVAKLQGETQLSAHAAAFALNLVSSFAPPAEGAATEGSKFLLSTAAARALLERAIATAQAESNSARQPQDQQRRNEANNLLMQLNSMTKVLEKYTPARLPALKRATAEIEQTMNPSQRGWNELNRLASNGTPAALNSVLEAAAKAPPEMRDHYYQRAAQLAHQQGDPDRARQIINDHVTNDRQRQEFLRMLEHQQFSHAMNAGKIAEARQRLASFKPQQRISALFQLVGHLVRQKEKQMATELLTELWASIEGTPETNQQLQWQLEAAAAYLALNPARSFEIIEATIEPFNELAAASVVIESFNGHGGLRRKEMLLRGGSSWVWNYLQQYGHRLAALSAQDFARADAAVSRLGRVDVRVACRVAMLQQILGAPPDGTRYGIGAPFGRGGGLRPIIR